MATRRRGSPIVASNREPADWYGLFPNPVVAEGVLDRLVNSAHHVAMEGRSFRPNQRPGRRVEPGIGELGNLGGERSRP